MHGRSARYPCSCSVCSAATLRLFLAGSEAHISAQRFTFVDALRGLAALSVVLYHAYEGGHIAGLLAHLPAWATHLLRQGGMGVAVFLVLSGVVISHSVAGSRVSLSFVGRFMLRDRSGLSRRIGLL
jgi:peptidoglycan/LPS O-acetylase OafA/YrhL